MRVALIGATGLVGAKLVPILLDRGHEVEALVRRAAVPQRPRLRAHVAEAREWPRIVAGLGADAAISALGTTMRKAGSEAGFRAVDLDMVLGFAAATRASGARRFVTVSSVGAAASSRNFYLRIKAEMEEALAGLGFERLDILRPGLLRGERGPDRRLGERIGIAISPLVNLALRGPLSRIAAIDADAVARAIAATLEESASGTFLHHNREIKRLAARRPGLGQAQG